MFIYFYSVFQHSQTVKTVYGMFYICTVFRQCEFAYDFQNLLSNMLKMGMLYKTNFSSFRESILGGSSNLSSYLDNHISRIQQKYPVLYVHRTILMWSFKVMEFFVNFGTVPRQNSRFKWPKKCPNMDEKMVFI